MYGTYIFLNVILQIEQTPHMGGGGRGGRPFRGAGPGHFGSRPNGSGPPFRGRGRGRGRGRQFSAAAALVQGKSSQTTGEPLQYLTPPPPYASGPGQAPFAASAPVWPPPRMAWCELCRVDCNTIEILEQHKNGKKHKRNLQVYEELQKLNKLLVGGENYERASVPEVKQEAPSMPEKFEGSEDKQPPQESISSQAVTEGNKLGSEQQNVSEEGESAKQPGMDPFEGRGGNGFKRKMRGGWGGKWMRSYEGSRRSIVPPKPKRIPLFCELCNVKCDSQVVFESHLTGKKHLSNLKRFQGHQATVGQAALQALYPALQALFPSNPAATTSFVPQYHEGLYVSQGIFQQPVMLPPGQASAGLATTSASAQDPKNEQSQVTSTAQNQDAAIVEAKNHP